MSVKEIEKVLYFYLDRQVFKIDKSIQPACLAIHKMSIPQYLKLLDAINDLAIAHLTRMGAMHGHCTSIAITEEMKRLMGDLKSLLGFSVHKTPNTRYSDPCAWWTTEVSRPINPNSNSPQQQLPKRSIETWTS